MNEGRSHRVTILYPVPFENFSSFFHELFRSRPRSGKVFSFEQINPKWDNLSPPQPLSLAQPPKREFFNNNGTKKLVTRRWRVGATISLPIFVQQIFPRKILATENGRETSTPRVHDMMFKIDRPTLNFERIPGAFVTNSIGCSAANFI